MVTVIEPVKLSGEVDEWKPLPCSGSAKVKVLRSAADQGLTLLHLSSST